MEEKQAEEKTPEPPDPGNEATLIKIDGYLAGIRSAQKTQYFLLGCCYGLSLALCIVVMLILESKRGA